jgi:hypothetical protein
LKVFEANNNRAKAFLRLFDRPGGRPRRAGQPSADENQLLRGAIVFAIAALDAYFHDLILEIVPRFGGSQASLSDALRRMAKDDPSLALRVSLASNEAARRAEFRIALDLFLSQQSFQGPEAVSRALAYVGSTLTWSDIDAASGGNAAARLSTFSKVRHEMVHRGTNPSIRRASPGECVDLVQSLVRCVDADAARFYRT